MLQLRVEATASAPHAGLVGAFRGRGRLLAGARVPTELLWKGLRGSSVFMLVELDSASYRLA